MIEIKFKTNKLFKKRIVELEYYKNLITQANILGKDTMHDSVHYIEHTYFKWVKDDIKIKLYIDDYSENSLCLDILSDNQEENNIISQKLVKLLKPLSRELKVKRW